MITIEDWIQQNRLEAIIWDEETFSIKDVGKFLVVRPQDDLIFDRNFELVLSDEQLQIVMQDESIDYLAFNFGSRWYYSDSQTVEVLKELKYLGKEQNVFEPTFPFLGIHGSYDLCNGSRSYSDWCTKAKFAGYDTLGIAEENTLAGALVFQNACEKAGIKSIIGETVIIQDKDDNRYKVKLYCANERGWKNLLLINAQINVHNGGFVTEEEVVKHSEGLHCVLSPEVPLRKKMKMYTAAGFTSLSFQFDTSKWDSDERDKEMLLAVQSYLKVYQNTVEPVCILDAYYLDQKDARIRKDLNAIGKVGFRNQSGDQYFKTPNEIFSQIASLFTDDDDRFIQIAERAMDRARLIADTDFKIDTGKLHLPKYVMSEHEASKFETNEELFWNLIDEAMEEKVVTKGLDKDLYDERLATEAEVIVSAGLIDYFLIIWDILNWARNQGFITGYGRGSAAGSLIAYLLGIVQTNPFDYDLLFERFLNEGRLYKKKKVKVWRLWYGEDGWFDLQPGEKKPIVQDHRVTKVEEVEIEIKVTGSMPDIDNDVQGLKRSEIKRYIESKYGQNRVASIGTYGTFKIKAALKDLARRSGADAQFTNYVTGAIKDDDLSYTELFKYSNDVDIVKKFIQENPELIEKLPLVFDQPKIASMHAAGVIIVPESENGIYDQLPVKMVEGVLVSEWEMNEIEQAGFLKMDILGLKQLDKFADILNLIEESTGERLQLTDIPLDDPHVYEMFGKGYNEDVFQFGGFGLKGYTSQLMPETIEDLIATVALYRPGPIETGAHMRYIRKKNGHDKIVYMRGTDDILDTTYSEIVYQEQVQRIVSHVAGFTPNEADDVRKAMGKKITEMMKSYKEKFVEGAYKKSKYPMDEARWLWDQMETFAGYAFNKSHAACYAITGYHCQWFKVNYPLQFWTVSLRYASDDQVASRLSEMYQTSDITIAPVDINKSTRTYEADIENNSIYWTIMSVKQVGDSAVDAILKEREANGEFFSVTEFAKRMKTKEYSRSVKKNTIINLIYAGAFDQVHNIETIKDRFSILEKYLNFIQVKIDSEIYETKVWKEYRWILKQKELSGLGILDFRKLVHHTNLAGKIGSYKSNKEVLETPAENLSSELLIGGIITKCEVRRQTEKDRDFLTLDISDGQTTLSGVIWSDTYLQHKDGMLKDPLDKLIVLTVQVKFDSKFRRCNTFNTIKSSLLTIIEE